MGGEFKVLASTHRLQRRGYGVSNNFNPKRQIVPFVGRW
jgi:hypothetical protein